MTNRDKIIELINNKLFSNNLEGKAFLSRGSTEVFKCKYKDYCEVDKKQHPIWSPALGDDNTTVMVVGEAPSITEGPGAHIGGLFENWELNRKSQAVPLRDWVKNKNIFGTIPHYTDLAKCGVAKQQNKNELKKRIPKCVDYLFKEEINILQPKFILCLGNTVWDFVRVLENVKGITVFKLIHYSSRASLPLRIEDKKNIIWDWQVGSPSEREQIMRKQLSKLHYFGGESKST